MNNNKLTKKLQVLLTEAEVREVNRVILNEALETETRPVSVSAWIRDLIQRELALKTPDQKSILKQTLKNLKDK
jgi:plasmid stability protein|tara:strand:- start:360 stop:581 length:222 start_codon:yes stop_codon:yes gene_type:complete